MEAKCTPISFEQYEENCKPINYIPFLLSMKSNSNTPICIGFSKWENRIIYVDLYYDLEKEKYVNADRLIHGSGCKFDYYAFNKLHDVFKKYMYTDNFDKGYYSIIPPTDKKEVTKLNKQIKKALG